jgi:hypothetical protein
MVERFRVKDQDTRHEYTVTVVLPTHEVLDKPAVNSNGDPLRAKPHKKLTRTASKKDAKATPGQETDKANKEATA